MSPKLKNGLLFFTVLLIFQEIIFRLAFPIPELSNFDRANYIPGTELGQKYSFYRNTNWYWESTLDTNHQFVHELNQYGFRDIEWKTEKASEKKRVFLIGDSFLEGVMAEQSETIAEQIRQEDKKDEFEIMNLGIMGTGMNSYLRIIADATPIFDPDVVCLVLYSNDLSSKAVNLPGKAFIPQYNNLLKPRLAELITQYNIGSPIPSRFRFNQRGFLPSIKEKSFPWKNKEKILLNNTTPEVRNSMLFGKMNPFLVNQILREKEGLLKRPNLTSTLSFLSDYSKKSTTKFVICYIPARHQVSNYYYTYEKESCASQCPDSLNLTGAIYNQHQIYLSDLCSEYQIDFIDFTDVVEKEETPQQHLYWNYDGHMNAKGYQLIGKTLFTELSK